MREKIIKAIEKNKIIAIVRNVEKDKLIPLTEALYKGGIRLLEVTYNHNDLSQNKNTAQNIGILSKAFEGRMYIGAGTVTEPSQVILTKDAGGRFIISPNTAPGIIKATIDSGMVSIPGALTPSEIEIAHKNGADFVKLFPVTAFGPDYVKAVKAPLSGVRLLAVGGIDESNMREYLRAGISGFGVGSNIINKKMIADNDFASITELAEKYINNLEF